MKHKLVKGTKFPEFKKGQDFMGDDKVVNTDWDDLTITRHMYYVCPRCRDTVTVLINGICEKCDKELNGKGILLIP